jgi:hypothetical protein
LLRIGLILVLWLVQGIPAGNVAAQLAARGTSSPWSSSVSATSAIQDALAQQKPQEISAADATSAPNPAAVTGQVGGPPDSPTGASISPLPEDVLGMSDSFARSNPGEGIGADFFGLDRDFSGGLVIRGEKIAMKIGGLVKVDAIYDFNPIGSTDSFDVSTIEINAAPRNNSRLHARQTRLNWDTRWTSDYGPVRLFLEGDFFFNQRESAELGENRFRLRHAYAELNRWLIGQTWTTLSDVAASPSTLDFEGQVASVTTRRTQIRWTRESLFDSRWSLALAVEDPFAVIDTPPGLQGATRTQTPDNVLRLRRVGDNVQFQVAGVVRRLGFQPLGQPVIERNTWGVNFTQVTRLTRRSKFYGELLWGRGIGSFRGIPDAGQTASGDIVLFGSVGWMLGTTVQWNDRLSSNFTYAENGLTNDEDLLPDQIRRLTYLACNLIYSPSDRTDVGIEYLYGKRQDFDGQFGIANRVQVAFTWYLP